MVLKLHWLPDGPPSLSVRQALEYLQLPYELIHVDYYKAQHMTAQYEQKNPQKEIPVLEDDGFYLSESNAILQYICERYKPDSNLYPRDPKIRAVVNQRLCFNLAFIYPPVLSYAIAPIFFDYERTELGLRKIHISLDVFNTYLERQGTKYVAADHLTIADFPLPLVNTISEPTIVTCRFHPRSARKSSFSRIGGTIEQNKNQMVDKWYRTFKTEYPHLWQISESGMKLLQAHIANPPELGFMNHPLHPTRKQNN